MFTPTRLYIKQHSSTGLKYFGKTTRQDINEYKGSGTYWKRHLKAHGEEFVNTLWVSEWFHDPTEIEEFALLISEEANVVESSGWANLKSENGLDGMLAGKDSPRYGKPLSEETKRKISEAHKGMVHSEETRQKLVDNHVGMSGKHHSDETKRKISNGEKGELNYFFGKHHSEETKRKISEASRGRIQSAETKQKNSKSHLGKLHSEETKRKISELKMGIPLTAEHIQNKTNAQRKIFKITAVDGTVTIVHNAKQYCADHGYNYCSFTHSAKHNLLYRGLTIVSLPKIYKK